MAINPQGTYEALGKFIERRSPYTKAMLPNFGPGTAEFDKIVLSLEDNKMPNQFTNKHIVAEEGPYREFNEETPSELKSEDLPEEDFLHWKFDGVDNRVTKAIRIQYTHIRKKDGKLCTSFLLIGFTGDSH